MSIIGLDLSLTATGIATVDTATATATVDTITSSGTKNATLDDRVKRLHTLATRIVSRIIECQPALVVVEAPSLGHSRQAGEHIRAGLWWMVVSRIDGKTCPVAEVPPATLKRYAVGKGNAAKDAVLLATARRFPNVDVTNNNEADALWLGSMGARFMGHPIDHLPQAHLVAMDAVRWPGGAL